MLSQEDLAVALDLSNTLIRSLQGEIFFWSAGCEKLYGWSKQEAIGQCSHPLLQTSFPEPLHLINASLVRSGNWSGNLLHTTKDGRCITVASQWAMNPEAGDAARVTETVIDTSGTQAHLASIVDSTTDAVIGETLDSIVTSWNPAAEKIFEYSPSEMIGRHISVLFPPGVPDDESILIRRIQNGKSVNYYQAQRVSKSGRLVDISLTLSPIFDLSGRLVGISRVARDVSAEHAHRRDIFLAMERERLAAEAGEIGLWHLSPATAILHWNDRHKEIFGLPATASSPTLQEFFEFVHLEDRSAVQTAFENVLSDGEQLSVDYRIFRTDSAMRNISTTGRLHSDPSLPHPMLMGTSVDLTQQKATEEALRRANASLEEFAYAAAHDLQEPLRNISLSLQEITASPEDAPEQHRKEMMDIAIRNANRMQALIRDLLSFTRAIDAREKVVASTSADTVTAEIIQHLAHLIEENGATVSVHSPLGQVPIHRSHLVQLLQNLIGNSIKHRRPDLAPVIRIKVKHEKSRITVSVEDNGIGIAPQYHNRVFGVFKRLNYSQPGNGIGLAVCKRIVEHYGGTIWVESEAGRGTTFFFCIPQAHQLAAAQ